MSKKYPIDSTSFIVRKLASYPRLHTGGIGIHWWLFVDDHAVAYAKTDLWPNEGGESFTLSSVEVRKEYRGSGILRPFFRNIEKVEGHQLFSTGNWTAMGEKALRFLPVASDSIEGVFYPDQTFVKDWEKCLAKYE